MYTNKEMEEIFGIPFETDEEYDKKRKKLDELERKYKEKFGEEIEYSMFDFEDKEEYNAEDDIDDEIKLVEKALKDDKPFEPIEYHDIYFRGHKLDWFY